MRSYRANRARLKRWFGRGRAKAWLQNLAMLILFAWLLVFALASETQRQQLTEQFQQSLDYFNQTSDGQTQRE